MTRAEQVAANLARVRADIEEACAAAGRDPATVTLLAVTKTWPLSDVLTLAGLGVADMGENRHQEAAEKAAETRETDIRWHFVGQLQTNKARAVASYASVVHSVDRERLVDALAAGARDAGRVLEAFVQVSLDGDTSRGGVAIDGVHDTAAAIAAADGLRLAGVMALPPVGADALASYQLLAEVARDVRRLHPGADGISAGMSADLTEAIRAGSTVVRVGTALLGGRPPFVG